MNRFLALLAILLTLVAPAMAEPRHPFAPLRPDELAKIQAALPRATVQPTRPRRLLVFFLTEGYVHAAIPYGNEAFKEMGEKTGAFTVDLSDDPAVFTPEKLAAYDAVLFNSTTGLKFTDPAARAALLAFARSGKGIIGIHAATDNFPTWEEGRALLGGAFDGHPWTAGDLEAVKLDDPANPVVAPFGGKGFWINDEIYQMKAPYDRNGVRELMSLDMSKPEDARAPEKIHRADGDFPICWIKQTEGGGRVFYCSLGHNPSIYWTPQVLQVYLNGIQFALGDLPLDATPTGKLAPPPAAALAAATPDPINERPSSNRPAPSPAPAKPAEPSPTVAAPAAFNAPGSALAAGLRAVAAYDYGRDRAAIVEFDTFLRAHPDARAGAEAALLPLLKREDVATGAKDWICRWLGTIGSDASIPALQKLTADPKLSPLAVSALLDLRTPAAREALLGSLGTAPAALRPAIIGAMGRADVANGVPVLARAAASADPAESAAALDALGIIGTPAALEALRAAQVAAPLATAREWALLHAADRVAATDAPGRETARPVFLSLLKSGRAAALRNAAAADFLHADPAAASGTILTLLGDSDANVRSGAVRWTALLPPEGIGALAATLTTLDPATQVGIINHLVEKPSAGAEPILRTALASTRPEVRLAAVAGYGAANLPDAGSVLLPRLAAGGDEAAAASASLEKLSQPGTDAQLEAALTGAPGPVKAALLTILAARQDRAAFGLFVAATGDADPAVATAAFQGVASVAGGDDLDRVAGLFPQARTHAERTSLDTALLHCARVASDKDKAADFLIDGLRGASPETKGILFAAVASVPSAKAAAYLQDQLAAPSLDVRKEVIRALGTVHAAAADKLLLRAASQGTEPSEKILALRGYLDSVQAQAFTTPQRIEAYKTAWPLTVRPEEKQAILDALQHIRGSDALKAFNELSAQAAKST